MIDEYGGLVPNRSQTPEQFNTNVQTYLSWLANLAPQINSTITEIVAMANVRIYKATQFYNMPDTVYGDDGGTYRCKSTNIKGDDPVVNANDNWEKLSLTKTDLDALGATLSKLWDNLPNAKSDAVNSNSSNQLATSKAVKTAYDLAGHGHPYLGSSANAVSASKWKFSRELSLAGDCSGSVSIDGSGNTVLNVTVNNDSHSHSNYLSNAAKASLADNDGYGNANVTFNHKAGTPIVDGSAGRIECSVDNATGNMVFEVGDNVTAGQVATLIEILKLKTDGIEAAKPITGSLIGNADTATKWKFSRELSLSGDCSGSVSIDGSGNTVLNVSVVDSDKLDGYHATSFIRSFIVEDGDGTERSITQGKEWKFVEGGATIDINWTDTSTGSDADPFDITFTVLKAPKWTTARTITLAGDCTGSVSIDGSANKTLTVAVNNNSHNHTLAQKSTRTTTGTWTITGLTVGKPMVIGGKGSAKWNLKITSGTVIALNSYVYIDANDSYTNNTTPTFTIIPTSTTVVISVLDIDIDVAGASLRAYQ